MIGLALLACITPYDEDILLVERCLPTVSTLRPRADEHDVPLDARFLAVLEDSDASCDEAFVLFDLEHSEEGGVDSGTGRTDGAAGVVHFTPERHLDPEDPYLLVVEDEVTGLTFANPFTTGTEDAARYDLPPEVAIEAIDFVDGDRSSDSLLWSVTLSITHEPSDRELSLVHLDGGESLADPLGAVFANGEGLVESTFAFETAERRGEVCFRATQEDEAGRGGETSEQACQELPEVDLACSTAAARPGVAAWALLPLLAWRRRRCS